MKDTDQDRIYPPRLGGSDEPRCLAPVQETNVRLFTELEDRNREQLYEIAKQKQIAGRSKMGKWDLIKAIRESS